jgi:catechol 2,3-dioxygenase-like lactoylglutathione lyase family enzyme
VQDVDRSVAFYGDGLGWSVDHDQVVSPEMRFVRVTPPGSACSICFGLGLDMMPEGSAPYLQVVVEDADAAPAYLRERGIECQGGRPALGPVRAVRRPRRQPVGAAADRRSLLTSR